MHVCGGLMVHFLMTDRRPIDKWMGDLINTDGRRGKM
jgi:hypothetical protein